jgi:pyruvate/2-oxoacid:ferredoxin oxidoreductase beta subunit
MSYIDVIKEREDLVSPGISACAGCGGELVLRKVLQVAGSNTIVAVPPGCMAGAGVIGWNFDSGMKVPVCIPLLDNTASFLSGLSHVYQRKGRGDVNIVAFAGDGASADCGFQSLSGAAERNEKILYICYDNEGYMNTGYQRSSTSSLGSMTSTTPIGSKTAGKQQHQKYMPLIMAMHHIEYCATASPSNMSDLIAKVTKGLEASKNGFAYLHVFSPCPTGWGYDPNLSIEVARQAVRSNLFPLWEMDSAGMRLSYTNRSPVSVAQFAKNIRKFRGLTDDNLASLQALADARYQTICNLAGVS